MNYTSLGAMLRERVEQDGHRPALMIKTDGAYRTLCWADYGREARRLALGLWSLGVRKGDKVGLYAPNGLCWVHTDLACQSLGAADVPIYPTNTAQQAAYILDDSQAKVVVVGTRDHLDNVMKMRHSLDSLQTIVADLPTSQLPEGVFSLDQIKAKGDGESQELYDRVLKEVSLDDLATIIYTSGTTGDPKGVMLTHRNFLANCDQVARVFAADHNDLWLSFLPLSHSLERTGGHYMPMYLGACVAHAESIDAVGANMLEVNPTVITTVPRLLEKVHAKVMAAVNGGPALKKRLFYWSAGVGRQALERTMGGWSLSLPLMAQRLVADQLVFGKLRDKVGGRLRFFISGGAPLAKELATFFHSVSIPVLEGYGLTETSPVLSLNTPDRVRLGTVGQPLPDTKIKIAPDGEILAKGPQIFQGYFNKPEDTAEALEGGWFHTGDVGFLDKDNYLTITDRKKDLLITAGGKNVAPQNIENKLKMDPLIEQVALIGDKRRFISALVVPAFEELEREASKRGIGSVRREEMVNHPAIKALFQSRIESAMEDMASYERVKKFTLLPAEFTQETGELTPTLKVKRKVIQEKFSDMIEAMYAE